MHIHGLTIDGERFPADDAYPYNLEVLRATRSLTFDRPVTFFVGENGSGKSTLLAALARRCGIHIWSGGERTRYRHNRHEDQLHRYLEIETGAGPIVGAFFASEIFRNFSGLLDEWAAADPGVLRYFGGRSLVTQSYGESHMAFFRARLSLEGLYLLDEPESALSPTRLLELLAIIEQSATARAQFIIASHSPFLLSCPGARIYGFDGPRVAPVTFAETDHYRVYRDFFLRLRSTPDGDRPAP